MSAEVITSIACDYLTATVKDQRVSPRFHPQGSALFRHEADCGEQIKPFRGSGFTGWQCGAVQVSTREHACMVRLSSHAAALSWSSLAPLADNVTRIDLQATVQLGDGVTERIDEHLDQASAFSAQHKYKPIVRWIRELAGGYTLYLGARDSNVFGRIYDKWQRNKLDHYKNCVRYEVQFQGKLAKYITTALLSKSSPIPTMADYISQFFVDRGVVLELHPDAGARYSCSRQRSDDDKCLAWLASAVRPSVMRLIDAGRGEDTLRALGLISDAINDLDQSVQET